VKMPVAKRTAPNPNLRFWTAPDLSKDDANALDAILAEPPGAT